MKRTLAGGITALALAGGLTLGQASHALAAPHANGTVKTTAGSRGTGVDTRDIKKVSHVTTVGRMPARPMAAGLPASVDLTKYANTPGDQGRLNSCVTWATGYTGYGVLMNEEGIKGGPMAPMFLYSQIDGGRNEGTSASVALPMLVDGGIDTRSDYTQGDYDNTDLPTDAERANAANYKLTGYQEIPVNDGDNTRQAIEQSLAAGSPVPIGMALHENFNDMDSQTAANFTYQPEGGIEGSHEITIVGYTDQGVILENSWGQGWGANGFFTLSWDVFLNSGDVNEINAMGSVAKTTNPTPPTTDPTTAPTSQPTSDPTSDPTDEPTADPTDDPTSDPTDDPSDDWNWDWNWGSHTTLR